MDAAIYARISADHTGQGLGVERQLEDCRRLASARGWTVKHEIVENSVSASKGDRPGFTKLLEMLASGEIQAVAVWHIDRLLRKLTDLESLIAIVEKNNAQLATVTGDIDLATDTGRMVGRILASVARAEVERKSTRQKRANLQRASKGLPHVTHRPMGYEADCMTIRPDEAETLHVMAKLVLAGNSYQETAWQLNEQGHRNTNDGKFLGLTVRKYLTNKRYAGIRDYQGVEYPAQWPAIFDTDTWQQLQIVVKLRRDLGASRPLGKRFLLTGLLFCGECGNMLTGVTEVHSRTKKQHRAYRCFRKGRTERQGGCGKIYRNADHLETYIKELVLWRLDTPALATLLNPSPIRNEEIRNLLADRLAQQERIESMVDDYATGLLTRIQLARAKQTAEAELERIEQEIGRLTAHSAAKLELPLDKTLAEAYEGHRDEWRRRLLDLLVERVVLLSGNMNKTVRRSDGSYYRFNPELIDISWRD